MSTPQDEMRAIPSHFDLKALEVARRFTQDTEPQRRASLQVAVVEAMQFATAAQAEALAAARRDALEEAAKVCDARYQERWSAGLPREASAARNLAIAIRYRATLTPTAPGAQEQA